MFFKSFYLYGNKNISNYFNQFYFTMYFCILIFRESIRTYIRMCIRTFDLYYFCFDVRLKAKNVSHDSSFPRNRECLF